MSTPSSMHSSSQTSEPERSSLLARALSRDMYELSINSSLSDDPRLQYASPAFSPIANYGFGQQDDSFVLSLSPLAPDYVPPPISASNFETGEGGQNHVPSSLFSDRPRPVRKESPAFPGMTSSLSPLHDVLPSTPAVQVDSPAELDSSGFIDDFTPPNGQQEWLEMRERRRLERAKGKGKGREVHEQHVELLEDSAEADNACSLAPSIQEASIHCSFDIETDADNDKIRGGRKSSSCAQRRKLKIVWRGRRLDKVSLTFKKGGLRARVLDRRASGFAVPERRDIGVQTTSPVPDELPLVQSGGSEPHELPAKQNPTGDMEVDLSADIDLDVVVGNDVDRLVSPSEVSPTVATAPSAREFFGKRKQVPLPLELSPPKKTKFATSSSTSTGASQPQPQPQLAENITVREKKRRSKRAPRQPLANAPSESGVNLNFDPASPTSFPLFSTSERRARPFARKAFVITLRPKGSPTQPNNTANDTCINDGLKARLTALIILGGGIVFDSWEKLYSVDLKSKTCKGRRWREGGSGGIRWVGRLRAVNEVLCIADQAIQTPKYLMALALGVPCVSTQWVEECIDHPTKEWRDFVLPAGKLDGVDHEQTLDPLWGTDSQAPKKILNSESVRKPLRDSSILFVTGREGKVPGVRFFGIVEL
ncbi:hypothetical protein BOTBODRAFT_600277 [Botryobasidium botryosum FD-172 SS1]|uniref:BRCT domain-containing protein n=1 Tax=Botryobasidium botryosum (strain FD-172 SS1) TaxID=930990 RepID=A0A067MZ73_BOTB1|nr:hypothetical protein BOTBODRAFT_600277 [Botryobasidium botryosum FD-172 SS1]